LKNFKKNNTAIKQVNESITYRQLRVVGEQGQSGVMYKNEALDLAKRQQVDLVVINEKSDPPIAKLLDAGKYFYEQKRKQKEAAKKQRESKIVIKEMQFRLGIGDHDFDTKLKNIIKFLDKGNKVKCVIRFKGRENANKQQGFGIMDRIIQCIQDCDWDAKPAINGNRMIGVLTRKE